MNCSRALHRPAIMTVLLLLAFNVQPALAEDKAAEWKAAIVGHVVVEQVGKTGVVAIYRNGPGPTVMVRTELEKWS
jgi:hypothetical protein